MPDEVSVPFITWAPIFVARLSISGYFRGNCDEMTGFLLTVLSSQLSTLISHLSPPGSWLLIFFDFIPKSGIFAWKVGKKVYELKDHLGNVRSLIKDYRADDGSGNAIAALEHYAHYYPFGMQHPGRNGNRYRFGFNGQEKDDEIYGTGNSMTAKFWQYDARLGRRWNVDPKPNCSISQYAVFSGNPIWFSDHLGDTVKVDTETEKSEGFKKWKNSEAGKKFYERYHTGGSREHINVEIFEGDIYDFDGNKMAVSGLVEVFVVSGSTRKKVISQKEYDSRVEDGFDVSNYTTTINKGEQIIYKIQYSPTIDKVNDGSVILHETQHLRISDYTYRMYNNVHYYSTKSDHIIMLNNYKQPGFFTKNNSKWALPKGNGIFDFNAERWDYFNEHREKGETDADIDKKAYDSGRSSLFMYE